MANVIGFLRDQHADVIAIYEVEGRNVWRQLMDGLPGYSWFITEGQNTQEILLGTASSLTAFVTQRIEFNARDAFMRPGALMSVRHDGHDYTLLFLHLASMNDPRGFGLRQDMVDRAFTFKREVVDVVSPVEPNFIFLGDLNTMGLEYDFAQPGGPGTQVERDRASAEHEIARLSYEGGKVGMRVLRKTHDATWRSLSDESNLDHVVAADHLRFRQFWAATSRYAAGRSSEASRSNATGSRVSRITRFSSSWYRRSDATDAYGRRPELSGRATSSSDSLRAAEATGGSAVATEAPSRDAAARRKQSASDSSRCSRS